MTVESQPLTEYGFTLRISGDDVEAKLDELFEAGCDDASFGSVDGIWHADFDREATSLEEAIASAITDVNSVEGVEVKRVEPDDLVTVSEIAQRLGRSRESIRLIVAGQRGDGDFPTPFSHSRDRNKLWHWFEVAQWAKNKGIAHFPISGEAARSIMAINCALELRGAFDAGLPQATREVIAGLHVLVNR